MRSAVRPEKINAVRQLYAAIRHINFAGGFALEAHERVSLLTVAAGLRANLHLSWQRIPKARPAGQGRCDLAARRAKIPERPYPPEKNQRAVGVFSR